jgi:hypothetical protein
MNRPISYPVPWDIIFGLTKHMANGTQESIDRFTTAVTARIQPAPIIEGLEHLPANPRFILVPNHYQRKGLWILHCASVITQAIRHHYGPGDPPVRWVVTANWPPIKIGPWKFPSPGDLLLPKVAHVLHCYPVQFVGNNPAFTANSIRRILKDAAEADRPIAIFPEGVAGVAGVITDPLPGVDRVLSHLGKKGLPAVPCGISENGRFVIRFGPPIPAVELAGATDAASLCLSHVKKLI